MTRIIVQLAMLEGVALLGLAGVFVGLTRTQSILFIALGTFSIAGYLPVLLGVNARYQQLKRGGSEQA